MKTTPITHSPPPKKICIQSYYILDIISVNESSARKIPQSCERFLRNVIRFLVIISFDPKLKSLFTVLIWVLLEKMPPIVTLLRLSQRVAFF